MLEEDYDGDAQDLKEEGFIVPDDHYSQGSDIDDEEQAHSRKDLLRRTMERQMLLTRQEQKPYVHYPTTYDLTEFKAVAFKRKNRLIDTNGISGGFPITLLKIKKDGEKHISIKDNLEDIIKTLHGST